MVRRVFSLALVVVTLGLFNAIVRADDASDKANTHEGKVVSVTGSRLVMTDLGGKNEHTMNVATDARISCDGKVCKLSELKPGQKIRVMTKPTDKTAAVRVEALDKNLEFEKAIK